VEQAQGAENGEQGRYAGLKKVSAWQDTESELSSHFGSEDLSFLQQIVEQPSGKDN
jgi:hypothetical protein